MSVAPGGDEWWEFCGKTKGRLFAQSGLSRKSDVFRHVHFL